MNIPFLFQGEEGYIRIPIWGHIPIDKTFKRILSHSSFFRLKGIRQLSFAHYVFPGANHSRFEHSIGVYHLARLILQRLIANPLFEKLQTNEFSFDEKNCKLILVSSLLHDIGHYPHAHIIEEIDFVGNKQKTFKHHQDLANERIFEKNSKGISIADIISDEWKIEPRVIIEMIEGKKILPFSKIISGTLDVDKMDYLMRDAYHCNVPYGGIDIWRLIESFVPDSKRKRFAITTKGISPLESLLFSKYMMMKNVYWHHTVRTFALMLTRAIQDILEEKLISQEKLQSIFYHNIDDKIFYDIQRELKSPNALLIDIIERTPYKRAFEFSMNTFPINNGYTHLTSYSTSPRLRKQKENELVSYINKKHNLSIKNNEILIDTPSATSVFDYQDLEELQIYYPSQKQKGTYIPFHKATVSAFTSNFIQEFLSSTKVIRILVTEKHVAIVRKEEKNIKQMLKNS